MKKNNNNNKQTVKLRIVVTGLIRISILESVIFVELRLVYHGLI